MERRKVPRLFVSGFLLRPQGDAFSPLLFVLMIDPLIKILKTQLGDRVEVLYYMDDLKASTDNIETAVTINIIVKTYAKAVGLVINNQ